MGQFSSDSQLLWKQLAPKHLPFMSPKFLEEIKGGATVPAALSKFMDEQRGLAITVCGEF